ncbi:MAG: PucR family transcriptional regulator [Clostridiales bacterium]|nr:PucR family transcriptional regulator [Clostridiales bacterium]
MGYTVKDLLESNKFPEMQLISDHSGIDREIKGARIIEMPEIEKFLVGGELLLTSMRAYEDTEEDVFLYHLKELDKKQISGFIVKCYQRTEHLKRLFNILMEFSQEYHLPVIEISEDLYFWGIIKHILLQLCDIETAKLKYFKMTHDNLSNILLNMIDSRESIERIFFLISTMLGNPVGLYNADGTCFFSSNSETQDFRMEKNITEYKPEIITRYQYLCQKRKNTKYVEYIKKLDIFKRQEMYFVVSEQNEPLGKLDFIALENIIITLQFSLIRHVIEENLEKRHLRRVVTFRMDAIKNIEKFTNAQIKETEMVEKEIIRYLPREHIFLQTNQIVYIHRETERETGLEFRKKLEKLQQTIQEFLVNRGVEIDFLIGIGKTVTGYHELKESFKSSKIALKYIKVIRRIIGDEDKSVIDSTKIGFFNHVLEKMKDINQLQAFIPESLNKLRQHDIQKNGELVDTLECYLNVNQSLKKTSELMFIHYRTASYRLQKIIEITNIDFNNPAEVLSVRIGLIAIRVLEVM